MMPFKKVKESIRQGKNELAQEMEKASKIDEKNILSNLPYVILIAVLGILHVANNHVVEYKIRKINSLEKELKELRWVYMTSKSELMYKSKQSEVSKMIGHLHLKELDTPPHKIKTTRN